MLTSYSAGTTTRMFFQCRPIVVYYQQSWLDSAAIQISVFETYTLALLLWEQNAQCVPAAGRACPLQPTACASPPPARPGPALPDGRRRGRAGAAVRITARDRSPARTGASATIQEMKTDTIPQPRHGSKEGESVLEQLLPERIFFIHCFLQVDCRYKFPAESVVSVQKLERRESQDEASKYDIEEGNHWTVMDRGGDDDCFVSEEESDSSISSPADSDWERDVSSPDSEHPLPLPKSGDPPKKINSTL
ncbi:uncharacterized protein LOC119699023 [Motacilla alba alba]|uniref:uncharacterized protein LOC119699023 n=1 Tax=Motacilla alba alba TaxID=1094192 RepID=UPI0018D565A6|nr:uncharacterized protein LOC119699023 [Motacilla alba alba]